MKLLLVLSVGAMAAVPLLAPSPAQALTACASVTTTLTAAQSCTIDDGGTTYYISLQTGTFPNAFPSPSNTTMFWWGDATKAGLAANAVMMAFGVFPNLPPYIAIKAGSAASVRLSLDVNYRIGPLFAYSTQNVDVNIAYRDYNAFQSQGLPQGSPDWSCCGTLGPPVLGLTGEGETRTWATSSTSPPPVSAASVPGPLPVLGVAAAFGFSRKLRKRTKRSTNSAAGTLGA